MNRNHINFRIATLQPSMDLSPPIKTLYQTERTKRWFNYPVRTCRIISKCVDLQVAQSGNKKHDNWECVDLRSCLKLIPTDGGTRMKLQVIYTCILFLLDLMKKSLLNLPSFQKVRV